jgi:hypothetical protein
MMFMTSDTFAARTALVDDREVRVIEALGDRARAHHAADVRRDHDEVVVLLLPHFAEQHRRRINVVDRDIEESLDLVGVQVDRQHAMHADAGEHVGHHLRRDRDARGARPAILAGIAEIRDHRR